MSPKDEAVFCTPPGTAALHRATVCWCWSSVFTSPSALIPQVCTHNWCCCRFLRPNALVSNIIADVIILRLAVNEASQDRGSPPVSIEQTVRGGFVTYSPERSTIMADSKSSERIRGRRSTEERGRRESDSEFSSTMSLHACWLPAYNAHGGYNNGPSPGTRPTA